MDKLFIWLICPFHLNHSINCALKLNSTRTDRTAMVKKICGNLVEIFFQADPTAVTCNDVQMLSQHFICAAFEWIKMCAHRHILSHLVAHKHVTLSWLKKCSDSECYFSIPFLSFCLCFCLTLCSWTLVFHWQRKRNWRDLDKCVTNLLWICPYFFPFYFALILEKLWFMSWNL